MTCYLVFAALGRRVGIGPGELFEQTKKT